MKVVGFHSNELNIRGTNVALYDYALYNEELLGNKSYIISNANSDLTALKKFQDRFDVFLYNEFKDSYKFAKEKDIEYVYYVKAGDRDGKEIPNTKSLIHAVFQHKDPHGDAYAYISKWLAIKMDMPEQYIPYIVTLPAPKLNYREKLNIPDNTIVIGRHGGYTEFDLPFVHNAVYKTAQTRDDIIFLFMNTQQFAPAHKNIIHVNSTYDLQNKSNFIDTCDYMLHGRNMGESFGLAVGEFLYNDKPVISWTGGNDQNHREILKDKGVWYSSYEELLNTLTNIQRSTASAKTYSNLVKDYSPERVMIRFNDIFLSV
jgi:hypothetical protein